MTPPQTVSGEKQSNRVFIVHGHNDGLKETVARHIEKLGLEAVILHEKPNKGQTIIEKLHENASGVGFAIILLTADDVGKAKAEKKSKPRARQNVILELGFFVAKLGRARVCALYEEEVEVPSDLHGLLYTRLDEAGAWRSELEKELKAAGFDLGGNRTSSDMPVWL